MTPTRELWRPSRDEQAAPDDAYGPGYTIHCLRENFHDLRRQIGLEAARAEVAEIINAAFEGRRHNG